MCFVPRNKKCLISFQELDLFTLQQPFCVFLCEPSIKIWPLELCLVVLKLVLCFLAVPHSVSVLLHWINQQRFYNRYYWVWVYFHFFAVFLCLPVVFLYSPHTSQRPLFRRSHLVEQLHLSLEGVYIKHLVFSVRHIR